MANTATNASCTERPTLTDIDSELLRNILAQEAKYFQQASNAVRESDKPLDPTAEQGSSLLVKIATSLLRHGKNIQDIYDFFKQLIPRRYLTTLACPVEPEFKVVSNHHISSYSGIETPEISNKESNSQLHPQELEIYCCALVAAQYPVLATSDDSLDIAAHLPVKQTDPGDASDGSLSPASKECMFYGRDPIRRSSIFEIGPEDLTELVRKAFCLTHRRHDYYLREYLGKLVMNDPAKLLVKELRELELIYDQECHRYYKVELFRQREDYERWLQMEKSALANIIRDQEKYIKAEVQSYPNEPPLTYRDKHPWFKILLEKLFRSQSMSYRLNPGTNEAIPKEPLSPMSWRFLNEFGERYRIRSLYRKVCLFDYLARNFDSECKVWYLRYVTSVLEAIFLERRSLVTKDEVRIVKVAIEHLSNHVKNFLTRINRVFPRNLPEGRLQEVIRLLTLLVAVDEDDTFGERNGITVGHYLKMYAKEEMQTNYERQKMVVCDQLKLRAFQQQLTPRMVSLMILDISEKIRHYRMYFKQEFIRYFDIVEMAVEVFYGLLMEDVLELCDIHPVNQQHQNIDYLMIALTYRLTSFDHDTAWENYLSFEGQIWRPTFLKHSLAWISSLHGKLHDLICSVLEHDNWQGLHTDHTPSVHSMDSQKLHQSTKRSRPRQIFTPLTSTPSNVISTVPSHTSAFVPVNSRRPSVEKGFSSYAGQGSSVTSDIASNSGAVTADQPSCSNVEATKDRSDGNPEKTTRIKIPGKPSNSSLPSTKSLGNSVTSQSSESVYADAKSDFDDYASCSGGESDQVAETVHPDYTTIPVSSSFIDTISGINRLINVVRHFSQLLCPKKSTNRRKPLRMSPEDPNEIHEILEQGRINMAAKLGEIILSVTVLYGYYVIGCESCGMSDDVLEPIIGQRCLTRSLSLIQENGIRPCRHRTMGLERCNRTDSNGSCTASCVPISQTENSAVQCERVVVEMCVRLNNVRSMKKLLSTLIEAAVQNVLAPGSGTDFNAMAVSDMPGLLPTTGKGNDEPSTSASYAVPNDVVDKYSIEKTVDELQEIEDGLVKLMAYRANEVIKKLLQLLLTLNLRSFNSRKRLQPVLDAARKTVHTLAVDLYPDCYAAVLRHFWLAIVQDFAEEKENLIYLNATAKDQANLLLDAASYFIEIFRAEEDSVSLAFVSKTIEPVLQSLNFYTLPTRTLIQMYEALQQRNTSTARISDTLSSRHRYQRKPSNVFIGRVRIELHSEHPQHFSGRRFVECVSDRIRTEGNLGLGICAVPNGCDADSGNALGQYLLDNDMLCYVGKVVRKTADHDSDSDNDVDEELDRYAGLLIPASRGCQTFINNQSIIASSLETQCSLSGTSDSAIIGQEDATKPSRFIDSENVLYKFESPELDDESISSYHSEYHSDQSDNDNENSLVTVLFTRRNIDEDAKHFLNTTLHANAVVEELKEKLKRHSPAGCSCWPSD